MKKNSDNSKTLAVPYRLENLDAIDLAMHLQQPRLSVADYEHIRAFARTSRLQIPAAMEKAKEHIEAEFHQYKQVISIEKTVEFEDVAGLDLIDSFSTVESSFPWIKTLALKDDFTGCLLGIAPSLKQHCSLSAAAGPSAMLDALLAMNKFLRSELLTRSRTGGFRFLNSVEMKKLLVARALFQPENMDVKIALSSSAGTRIAVIAYQNACAEMLFARLPRLIRELFVIDIKPIRQKLFTRIARTVVSPNHRSCLMGLFPANTSRKGIIPVLEKVSSTAARLMLPDDAFRKLADYIYELKKLIGNAETPSCVIRKCYRRIGDSGLN